MKAWQPSRDAERLRLMLLKGSCEHNIALNAMGHLTQLLKSKVLD